MEGGIIDRLLISVGLDTKAVDKGMNSLQSTMRSGFKNIMSSVVAPALSMIGAFSAGDFIAQIGQEATSIQKYAEMLGMSTEEMSAWAMAADNFGVGADDLVDVLTDVNDKVTDLVNNDAGPFKELVDRGLISSFQKADGTLKTTQEIIYELSDVVKQLGGQQGAGLLKRLGFNDPKMISMMLKGGDALKQLVGQMRQAGGYTDEDAKNAKAFSLALKDMQRSLKMMLLPAFRLLSPLLAKAAQAFAFITKHARAFIPILTAIAVVMVSRMIPAAIKTAKELQKAFSIKKFAVVAALIALGLVLEDFLTWMEGGESRFGKFYEAIFGGVEGAQRFLDKLLEFAKVGGIIVGIVSAFVMLTQAILAVNALIAAFGVATVATVGAFAAAIAAAIVVAWELYQNWDEVTELASEAWEAFTGAMRSAWDAVTSVIDAWINAFVSTFSKIWNAIQAVGNWVGDFATSASAYVTAAGNSSTSTNNVSVRQENSYTFAPGQEQTAGFVMDKNADFLGKSIFNF